MPQCLPAGRTQADFPRPAPLPPPGGRRAPPPPPPAPGRRRAPAARRSGTCELWTRLAPELHGLPDRQVEWTTKTCGLPLRSFNFEPHPDAKRERGGLWGVADFRVLPFPAAGASDSVFKTPTFCQALHRWSTPPGILPRSSPRSWPGFTNPASRILASFAIALAHSVLCPCQLAHASKPIENLSRKHCREHGITPHGRQGKGNSVTLSTPRSKQASTQTASRREWYSLPRHAAIGRAHVIQKHQRTLAGHFGLKRLAHGSGNFLDSLLLLRSPLCSTAVLYSVLPLGLPPPPFCWDTL